MAFFDDFYAAPSLFDRVRGYVAAALDTPFDRRNRRLARRVDALRGLTDPQLAVLGITRDEIIPYVFGQLRRTQ